MITLSALLTARRTLRLRGTSSPQRSPFQAGGTRDPFRTVRTELPQPLQHVFYWIMTIWNGSNRSTTHGLQSQSAMQHQSPFILNLCYQFLRDPRTIHHDDRETPSFWVHHLTHFPFTLHPSSAVNTPIGTIGETFSAEINVPTGVSRRSAWPRAKDTCVSHIPEVPQHCEQYARSL